MAALAVTLNGAATLFHTDQRTIVNRRYEGMLMAGADVARRGIVALATTLAM